MKRLDPRGRISALPSLALLALLMLGVAMPTQAQFFSSSGAVNTAPTNVPVPAVGPVFDYTGNTLYVGNNAPGSFASIAGSLLRGNALVIGEGAGGVGNGTVTLSGANNLTQLSGAQGRLAVGGWGTALLTVSAGAILDAAVANASCSASVFCGSFIGNGAGSTGTLNITGSGSEVRTLQNFTIGAAAVFTTAVDGFNFGTPGGTTNAFVNVLAGGTLRTQQAVVGSGPNNAAALGTERGNGTVVVDGAGSRWLVTPNTVNNTAAGVTVGNRVGGQGIIDIRNGGQLIIDGSTGSGPNDFLNIGTAGGVGRVTVSGTGSSIDVRGFSPVIQVGRSGAGAESSFSVLAGATASSLFMNIGRDGASGRLLVDGAGSQLSLVGVGTGAAFMQVGWTSAGQATVSNGGRVFISDGGSDSRSGTGSPGFNVGNDSGSTGRLTITGPGSTVQIVSSSLSPGAGVNDNFNPFVGIGRRAGSSGELVIENGGKLLMQGNAISTVANSHATVVNIGGDSDTASGGRGTARVSGTGSELRVAGADAVILVGRGPGAVGQLTVENGGLASATNVVVGRSGGATGTLVIDNATLSLSGQQTGNLLAGAGVAIGQGGGVGTATIVNGGRVDIVNAGSAGASFNVGGTGAFPLGTGSLTVASGSQINISAAPGLGVFSVGRDGMGTALITGTSTVNVGDGSTFIGRLASGNGSLTVEGSNSLLTAGYVGVGRTPAGDGGTGRLTVSSGGIVRGETIEIGSNGFVGGNGGTLDGNVILHGTLAPGDSPGSIIINRSFRTGSGQFLLDIFSNGAGGYLTDSILFTLGTTFSFTGLEVTFNFEGVDPFAFAASGGFDLDTFLRSLNVATGLTTGLSAVFAPNETYGSLFATATFNALVDGAPLPELGILADGTVTISAIAPIPEPETWALMGLGLGALGWVARRRRAAKQA